MNRLLLIILFISSIYGYSNPVYDSAYTYLSNMIDGKVKYDFKTAVFVTENAFSDNRLNFQEYDSSISNLVTLCKRFIEHNGEYLVYDFNDRKEVLNYATVFKVMTDTLHDVHYGFLVKEHIPFTYDFEDFSGTKDWRKMFVTKLLKEKKGNCHSLPYLYKILVEELGGYAHLALAPNHIYIKHHSESIGMYNTELTSATFPIDGWLMASGYIHMDAVKSGIYMDRLNKEQSIAMCLLDLAKGFERKYGSSNDMFIEKCIDKVLEYYPNCINAMLFRSEIIKRKMDSTDKEKSKSLFKEYESLIVQIHQLGYRKMPDKMYMNWLLDLKENQEKYINKKVINNFNAK